MLPNTSNEKKDSTRHFFNHQVLKYAEFPPLVPAVMAEKYKGGRKPAGGFMVAKDKNEDIVCPMLRPDFHEGDMKMYKSVLEWIFGTFVSDHAIALVETTAKAVESARAIVSLPLRTYYYTYR